MNSPLSSLLLSSIERAPLESTLKGLSPRAVGRPLSDLGRLGLSLLRGDLPFPIAVLKERALAHNLKWMADFARAGELRLAPHGKTTMSPQLFDRQIREGAWAISAATASHVRTYRAFGVSRILLANQLVGRTNIRLVLDEIRADPGFDFYCLVDSAAGVEELSSELRQMPLDRPLQVLLEIGRAGGRTGVRTLEEGFELGRLLKSAAPAIALRGVETYEDVQGTAAPDPAEAGARRMLSAAVALAQAGIAEDWFSPGEILLSAGGSSYFDLVGPAFPRTIGARSVAVVLRSGCYLTHDSLHYASKQPRMVERSPALGCAASGLHNALEVWTVVQSVPERGRAICSAGKRDVSYDLMLPQPIAWHRPGAHTQPLPVSSEVRTSALFDQHAIVESAADLPWRVGDYVAFGIGHPCTTFDKWPLLHVVDDRYRILGGVRTFF